MPASEFAFGASQSVISCEKPLGVAYGTGAELVGGGGPLAVTVLSRT